MPIVSVNIDLSGMLREINKINNVPVAAERAVRRYIDQDAEPAFLKTIETWRHKPVFTKSIAMDTRGVIGQIWTDDDIYGWVNSGTDDHPIFPKKSKFLHFQENFTPKTKKGWVGSQAGGKTGDWAHPRQVLHHSIEAREFAKTIAEETQPKIVAKFREELRKL